MAHSLGMVYVHLVLPTKGLVPSLDQPAVRADLHGYMTGVCKELGCSPLRIGGGADHVHVFTWLSRTRSVDETVQTLKDASSAWLDNRRHAPGFRWQDDYGAFSVSRENKDAVVRFITRQDEIHRKTTFEDELDRFRQRAGDTAYKVDVHLVFSTKSRIPFLTDQDLRLGLHERMTQICEGQGCPTYAVGGVEDHVHLLLALPPQRPIAKVVRALKISSLRWLRHHGSLHPDLASFFWQTGYGAFSVSAQHVEAVVRYIGNQEEHHRWETFEDECRLFETRRWGS